MCSRDFFLSVFSSIKHSNEVCGFRCWNCNIVSYRLPKSLRKSMKHAPRSTYDWGVYLALFEASKTHRILTNFSHFPSGFRGCNFHATSTLWDTCILMLREIRCWSYITHITLQNLWYSLLKYLLTLWTSFSLKFLKNVKKTHQLCIRERLRKTDIILDDIWHSFSA